MTDASRLRPAATVDCIHGIGLAAYPSAQTVDCIHGSGHRHPRLLAVGARGLAGPAPEGAAEPLGLRKADQPRDLPDRQIARRQQPPGGLAPALVDVSARLVKERHLPVRTVRAPEGRAG